MTEVLTLEATAALYSLSVKFLRKHLTEEPRLPFYRCGRAIRVERSDAARWFAQFKDVGDDERKARLVRLRRDFR